MVHSQEMRGYGHPTDGGARWLGQMGSHERLQQKLRRWLEIRRERMWQSAARQQRQILHRREKEVGHLQHHGKFHCLSMRIDRVWCRFDFISSLPFSFPFPFLLDPSLSSTLLCSLLFPIVYGILFLTSSIRFFLYIFPCLGREKIFD